MRDFYYRPPDYRNRKFLTKRSSWFKLILFSCLFILLAWGMFSAFRFVVARISKQNQAKFIQNGKVAGAKTSEGQTENKKNDGEQNNDNRKAISADNILQGALENQKSKDLQNNSSPSASPQDKTTTNNNPPKENYNLSKPQPTKPDPGELERLLAPERVIASATNGYVLAKISQNRLKEGEYDLAVKGFQRVVELEPYWRDGWYSLALALSYRYKNNPIIPENELSDLEKARLAIHRALTIDSLDKKSQELEKIIIQALGK